MRRETIIVERAFEAPADFDRLQAAEDAVAWCLEQHRVTFLRSYLSLDARSMICVYTAPDAEAVRETQRRAGLPVLHLWTAQPIGDRGRYVAAPGLSTVVVERDFPTPMPAEHVRRLMEGGAHCLEANRAELLVSNLSKDLKRMVCVFEAPDAESVRRANRQIGVPVARAWTATVHPR